MELLVATKNKGKVKELHALLANLQVNLRSLDEFPDVIEVEETGKTFTENAELKAMSYARQTGLWTLADDSGLEVAALNGEPGVLSARYAGLGVKTSDDRNTEKLLRELEKTRNTDRSARFFCSIAISDETGYVKFVAEDECRGAIALSPIGSNGFGYDPVFIPTDFDQTFGELSDAIKQKISHRAKALEKISEYLIKFNSSELDQTLLHL